MSFRRFYIFKKSWESHTHRFKNYRDVLFGKKRPLPGMPRLLSKRVFIKIHGLPGFGSKDLSNPKDDKTKNDAMVGVYPLECPKPIIIILNKINTSRTSVKSDPTVI